MRANSPKLDPAKCSVTSLIRNGLRRSGLSVPKSAAPCRMVSAAKGDPLTARPSANSSNTPAITGSMVVEHVFLGDVAHFEIKLVELARRTVGADGFIAEARRNLEVAIETGDHDQLLELLRRLRQRVELSGMQP